MPRDVGKTAKTPPTAVVEGADEKKPVAESKPVVVEPVAPPTVSSDRTRVGTEGLSGRFPLIAHVLDAGLDAHVVAFRENGRTLTPENGPSLLAALSTLDQGQLEQVRSALVRAPRPHPQIKALAKSMKSKATVEGILELLSGRALDVEAPTPHTLRQNNKVLRGLNRELGRFERQRVKLLDGREPKDLYMDEQLELKELLAKMQTKLAEKQKHLVWGAALKEHKGPNRLEKMGFHVGTGLSIGTPGVWSAGIDPLTVVSREDEVGYRDVQVQKVARGSFLAGWARYTKDVGPGAGASYGWLYGGGDALMGKWAGVWIPAFGGVGVARNEEADMSSACLQFAVPIVPPTGITPGVFIDVDLFVDHPALTPMIEPFAKVVGVGIGALKPVFDPLHKGMAWVGKEIADHGRERRAEKRLKERGGQAPPGRLISGLNPAGEPST